MRLARYDTVAPSMEQRNAFSCGEPSLNRWLATNAHKSMESRSAVTYLLLDDEEAGPHDAWIAGYYCISVGRVRHDDVPEAVADGSTGGVPVMHMGRLAVDDDYQGSGWGAELLGEALLSAVSGAELIGARALLVDAISVRSAEFYRRFGFVESPIHPCQLFRGLDVVERSAVLD